MLLLSCQKDDDTYPIVNIISPEAGSSFSYGDTIRFIAEVQQKDGADNVAVLRGSSVMPFGSRRLSEDSGRIAYEVYYDDRYLNEGKYDLRFTAFNGENKTSAFVAINILPLEKRLSGVVAMSRSGMNREMVWVDSLGQTHQQLLIGDYPFIEFNERQQVAVIAPDTMGSLMGHYLYEDALAYGRDNPEPPGSVQYRGLISSGDYVYAFENTGRVIGLDRGGGFGRNFNLPAGKQLVKVAATDEYLLCGVKEVSTNIYHLLLLRKENGAVLKSQQLTGKPLALVGMPSGDFAVFLKKADDTEMGNFDPLSGAYTKYHNLPQEEVHTATATGHNTIAFSSELNIYEFDFATSTIPAVLYTFAADALCYDQLHKQLYVAQGSLIRKAQPGSTLTYVMSTTGDVIDFNLMYNK